ncbi:MAG TPA: hypothetical protein VMT32_19770 [Bryobacteraceae bacterium]|nr:hypothetical protein [Bryobacteraceae bacterium]
MLTRIAVLMTAAAGILPAPPRYVGVVTSDGGLWVDGGGVSSHATLFEGSIVQTEDAPAKLQLAGGARVLLDRASRAQVFQDHLLLEKGRTQLDAGAAFRIEARTLRVAPAAAGSRAAVTVQNSGVIEVGSLSGQLEVRNSLDVMVARVTPAHAVELHPDASGASLVTGCVSTTGKRLVLADEVSGVMIELRGGKLDDYAGKRIQLSGQAVHSRATAPADQVIQVSALKVLATGCSTAAAASTGAAATGSRARTAPGSGGGAASSASTGITAAHAVLGGIAVASSSAAATQIVRTLAHRAPISPGR